MASKQPFKLINITQKLTTWSLSLRKFVKHRLLFKRKSILLIKDSSTTRIQSSKQFWVWDSIKTNLANIPNHHKDLTGLSQSKFQNLFLNNLLKSWEITTIQSAYQNFEEFSKLIKNQSNSKNLGSTKQINSRFSPILIPSFSTPGLIPSLQKFLIEKRSSFDAIVLLPSTQDKYPQIDDESFATDFLQTYQKQILKNVVGYRLAHKMMAPWGAFLQSASEFDFLGREIPRNLSVFEQQRQRDTVPYANQRPATSRQIIDAAVCYIGMIVGDRDYTHLHSRSLVCLSEQPIIQNPEFTTKMYTKWTEGEQFPMPGSFALFQRKLTGQNYKNFVEYL